MPDREHALRMEVARLRSQLTELRARLREPEEIIRAIRDGEVDSFVVTDPTGEQIYSLRSVDLLYRRMVEEMREGAVALDSSGLIIYCNEYFAKLMKTQRATTIGTSVHRFVPEVSRGFLDALTSRPSDDATGRSELVLRAEDGTSVAVHASITRLLVDDAEVFCLIVADLTAERRREQLLAESRQKDDFLAMLGHELRNPIAPVRNAAELLRHIRPLDAQVQWAAAVIDRQVALITRMVDDLMDIARINRGKIRVELQEVDLADVIARAVETARPAIDEHRHQVTVTVVRGIVVHGDPVRLAQVVSNLLQNAAKFTPDGGHISVALEGDERDAGIIVTDDGEGIAAEVLPRIFDVFVQADSTLVRSHGGLGIGLALVRAIVEMHGGHVSAHSDGPGRGSRFVVTLPRRPAVVATAAPVPARDQAQVAPKRRVLIVDDNVDAAETLTSLLQHLGHEVRMLTDGIGVVDEARTFKPDAILLDLSLPGMSGYEVAAELRQLPELEGMCLIALTGYGQEEHRRRSREAGFDEHWVKPIDLSKLTKLLTSFAPRH